jgi:beta-lactamase regulating signal transducer with metallopeptidase domain
MKSVLVTSSVLILVLIALRYLLRGRISLRLQYALWLLAAARLLIPVSLPGSGLSILNTVSLPAEEPTVYVSSQGVSTQAPPPETEVTDDGQEVSIYYDDAGERLTLPAGQTLPEGSDYTTVPQNQVLHVDHLLRWLWLAGAGVMALWFLSVNVSFSRRVSRRARKLDLPDCPVPVYVSPDAPSPCLLGLVRQRIYLTEACAEDPAARRHVLAHELTHRRHGDPWWSLVRAACLCLYWFDPLVWWAAALSRRDCELACDEGAIRRLGEAERLSYGRTLVDMVARGASPAGLLQTATTMHSGKSGLRERISLIAKRPRMLAVTALCLAAVVAVTVVCTFTGARSDADALTAQLQSVPEAYADRVKVTTEGLVGGGLASYHIVTEDGEPGEPLFTVLRWDAVDFERHLCNQDEEMGLIGGPTVCWARSGESYYAAFIAEYEPDNPWLSEEELALQSALLDWAEETVLAFEGMEPFPEEDVQALRTRPFQYEGNHITAVYDPVYTEGGSQTLILSQPADQGDGGIWCVEQVWFGGEFPDRQVMRPDTDLTAAEYYAQLQSQANDGQADWATDPLEVCRRYAGSLEETPDPANFTLSEIYSSAPGSANAQAEESLSALLGQGEVTVELSYQTDGAWLSRSLTLSADDPAIQTLMGRLTDEFSWVDTHWTWPLATDPWADESLDYYITIHSPDPTTALNTRIDLLLYAGSPYVAIAASESVTGVPSRSYEVTPTAGSEDMAAVVRAWFDETRAADRTAARTVETAVDALLAGESMELTLQSTDRQSMSHCTVRLSAGVNGPATLGNLTDPTAFTWSRLETGEAPEEAAWLSFAAEDGSAALEFWESSELVRCTLNGQTRWLRAQAVGESPAVFAHMRNWYDEASWDAYTRSILIPDEGQDPLDAARAWVEEAENVRLQVLPESKYAASFVQTETRLWEDAPEELYDSGIPAEDRVCFSWRVIFVPASDAARTWGLTQGAVDYDGSFGAAPEGALMGSFGGVLYRTAGGWACGAVTAGP